jgi:hypothetical protein
MGWIGGAIGTARRWRGVSACERVERVPRRTRCQLEPMKKKKKSTYRDKTVRPVSQFSVAIDAAFEMAKRYPLPSDH